SHATGFALTTTHDAAGMHLTLDTHRAPDGTTRVQMAAVVHPPGSPWMAGRAVSHLHSKLWYPNDLLPPMRRSPPSSCLSFGTSAATSPLRMVAFQVAVSRVREATYLGMLFIFSPNPPA